MTKHTSPPYLCPEGSNPCGRYGYCSYCPHSKKSKKEPVKYTPEMAGSGQFGICAQCGLPPTPEGHDGCLGTLPEHIVKNACCGHGNHRQAYIQYWEGKDVRGPAAMSVQARMIRKRDLPNHRYACMNRPKPGAPWLQLEDGCGHTEKKSDASCTGCKWR